MYLCVLFLTLYLVKSEKAYINLFFKNVLTWADISVAIAASVFWKFGNLARQFTWLLSDFLENKTNIGYISYIS